MEKVHHIAIIKTIYIYTQLHRHTQLDIQYTMCKCISSVNLFSNFSNWKFSNSVMSCVHLAILLCFYFSVRCICFMYLLTSSQLLYFLPTAASFHLNSSCDLLLSHIYHFTLSHHLCSQSLYTFTLCIPSPVYSLIYLFLILFLALHLLLCVFLHLWVYWCVCVWEATCLL